MSSKHAAAKGTKDFLYDLLICIADAKNDQALAESLQKKKSSIRYRHMYYAQQKGYVTKKDGVPTLTLRGKKFLTEREVWELTITKPKRWDKKWRLVLFDIPKDKRKRRDIFRLRLKELGLVLYQDSVWVHPYPLITPVKSVADFYGLSKCVSFAIAEKLTGENHLKKHFGLS